MLKSRCILINYYNSLDKNIQNSTNGIYIVVLTKSEIGQSKPV